MYIIAEYNLYDVIPFGFNWENGLRNSKEVTHGKIHFPALGRLAV